MTVAYECEICGERMLGWADLSIVVNTGSGVNPDSRDAFTIAACWGCREAVTRLARNELLFRPLYISFLTQAKARFEEFKEELA